MILAGKKVECVPYTGCVNCTFIYKDITDEPCVSCGEDKIMFIEIPEDGKVPGSEVQ